MSRRILCRASCHLFGVRADSAEARTLSVVDFQILLKSGKATQVVDVRTAEEYLSAHIPGALNIPLGEIGVRMGDLRPDCSLVVTCHSGVRAAMACQSLSATAKDIWVLQGGTQAWIEAGHPTVGVKGGTWDIERQVRLVVGILVITFTLLSAFVNPRFMWGSFVLALGLTIAAVTNKCGLGMLLSMSPMNRRKA